MSRFLRLGLMIVSIGFFAPLAQADTVVLDSGETVMGEIVHRSPTQVTINVEGMPETFFLGEIQSIDGMRIVIPMMPRQKLPAEDIIKEQKKKPVAPYFKDEQDSLVRYMNTVTQQGNLASAPKAPFIPAAIPVAVNKIAPQDSTLNPSALIKTDATEANKNIVSTADGGIIVVGHEKLTKYDKDLNIIREVSISDTVTPSK